jgi:hypothetical protein
MTHLRSLLLAFLLILAYFGVWRQVRVVLVSDIIFPVVQVFSDSNNGMAITPKKGASLVVMKHGSTSQYVFSGFGNSFFLLGGAYFLAFGLGWKPVVGLFLIHQGITLLALLCLFLAIGLTPAWLYPMNLLVTYITPAATGMYVLTVGRGPSPLRGSG